MAEARGNAGADRTETRRPLRLRLDDGNGGNADVRWACFAVAAGGCAVAALVDPSHAGPWWAAGILCLGLAVHAWFSRHSRGDSAGSPGWLVVDDQEIARADARGRTTLARWDSPFGLSVLADSARSRAVLAFTTPGATRFLGLRLETARDADLARDLLERAITVTEADLEAAAGDTTGARLGAASVRPLLAEIERRDPRALQRMYLSDVRGMPIVVDRDKLAIGDRTFDLASPVEWRVFAFLDGEPAAGALYQATSVRQGASEAGLVCRASAELASWSVGRANDAPPNRDVRVAIDHLFMTPLRAVLAQAPRVPRPGPPSSRSRGTVAET